MQFVSVKITIYPEGEGDVIIGQPITIVKVAYEEIVQTTLQIPARLGDGWLI